jgi:hypothetical protein
MKSKPEADDLRQESWYIAAKTKERAEIKAQKSLNDVRRGTGDALPKGEVVFEGKYMESSGQSFLEHKDENGPTWEFTFYPEGTEGE